MTANSIIAEVSKSAGIRVSYFLGSHSRKVSAIRDGAIFRCRKEIGMSYAEIGRAFGMHHSSIITACQRATGVKSKTQVRYFGITQLHEIISEQANIICRQARQIESLVKKIHEQGPVGG